MPAHWPTGKRFLRFAELLSVNISSASQEGETVTVGKREQGRKSDCTFPRTRCVVCSDLFVVRIMFRLIRAIVALLIY